MKTLAGYTILYDAECPMCSLYSRAFIATGMLDKQGRVPYQQIPEVACPLVDRQRAVNEIALVNIQTGEVKYGINSLFKIIGNAFPVFGPLFNFKPFVWLMSKVYAFISYNRRVIIPAKANEAGLQPTFNLYYRLAYLLFTSISIGFVLTHYATHLTGLVPLGGPYREYMICSGQVLFQGIIISLYRPAKRWEYLGNR
jgi:predicted DCC family thiol-disulfide oxidoreductase YuxK